MMTNQELLARDPDKDLYSTMPWVLSVRFVIREDLEEEFIEKVMVPIEAMRHEESFLSFSMGRHPTDPCKFFFYEVWKSRREFLTVQRHRDYRQEYRESLGHLLREPIAYEEWYEMRADRAQDTMIPTGSGAQRHG